MKVETNTRRYEASHGTKPRGRGTWAFEVVTYDGQRKDEWAGCCQTLAEARREVLGRYDRGEVAEVVVLP